MDTCSFSSVSRLAQEGFLVFVSVTFWQPCGWVHAVECFCLEMKLCLISPLSCFVVSKSRWICRLPHLTLHLPVHPFLFSFSHFLCRAIWDWGSVATTSSACPVLSASHNQILNKSGMRERAYVTEEGRGVPVPWSPLWGRRQRGLTLMDEEVFFQREKEKIFTSLLSCGAGAFCAQARMLCPVPPTGNNLSDSITLQYLSRSHGLPGKHSARSSLPQRRSAS